MKTGCKVSTCVHELLLHKAHKNPPLEVLFADGLSAEEADALMSADGVGMRPELSDQFHSALSDEYYDVYSDAYYDSDAP
jgi:hypothetical protein